MLQRLFILGLLLLSACSHPSHSQEAGSREDLEGQAFPTMEVQLLNEQEIEIPGDLDAPVQVLVLAFEMESQKYVDPWTAYFRDSLQTDGPEVRYLEVPMISGAYRMVSGFINGGMRDGIDTGLHNNVGTFFGNRSPYFESLKMADREAVYLFVLDRKGIIRYSCISPKTPQKTRAVAETIETILEPS